MNLTSALNSSIIYKWCRIVEIVIFGLLASKTRTGNKRQSNLVTIRNEFNSFIKPNCHITIKLVFSTKQLNQWFNESTNLICGCIPKKYFLLLLNLNMSKEWFIMSVLSQIALKSLLKMLNSL